MANILIADDHDLVRETIAAYLSNSSGFDVVEGASLDEAFGVMDAEQPIDLMILDYNMPGMNGLKGLERAKTSYPRAKVALMSGVAKRDVATSAMKMGADGFIPKSLTAESLVNAIRMIVAGDRYFPFDFAQTPEQETTRFSDLSEREMQTLEQLCIGLSNKEIARNLGIQEVTVKLHVKNLMAKLEVANRTQAALLAKEHYLF